ARAACRGRSARYGRGDAQHAHAGGPADAPAEGDAGARGRAAAQLRPGPRRCHAFRPLVPAGPVAARRDRGGPRGQGAGHAQRPLSDTTTLTQRNVYILPTRAGFMLGATLLVLVIASINYQLNLGYLLTFLLAGCAVVGMHVCHATLRGLTMNLMAPDPQFAG